MSGKLTTHVLDTANGCPGKGIAIALWQLDLNVDSKTLLKTIKTNHDGRTEEPLLTGEELEAGNYPDPLFLDEIPIRFGISDVKAHYHLPLLVSPWSYSTYRGS
jgi:5-hydroxyisourate hydrolase